MVVMQQWNKEWSISSCLLEPAIDQEVASARVATCKCFSIWSWIREGNFWLWNHITCHKIWSAECHWSLLNHCSSTKLEIVQSYLAASSSFEAIPFLLQGADTHSLLIPSWAGWGDVLGQVQYALWEHCQLCKRLSIKFNSSNFDLPAQPAVSGTTFLFLIAIKNLISLQARRYRQTGIDNLLGGS